MGTENFTGKDTDTKVINNHKLPSRITLLTVHSENPCGRSHVSLSVYS
jgi:hypothetical protein